MYSPPPVRYGYESLEPYIRTFEWRDGETETVAHDSLDEALLDLFYENGILGDDEKPDICYIVDARGVAVLATPSVILVSNQWNCTCEVLDILESWPGETAAHAKRLRIGTLAVRELEVRYREAFNSH